MFEVLATSVVRFMTDSSRPSGNVIVSWGKSMRTWTIIQLVCQLQNKKHSILIQVTEKEKTYLCHFISTFPTTDVDNSIRIGILPKGGKEKLQIIFINKSLYVLMGCIRSRVIPSTIQFHPVTSSWVWISKQTPCCIRLHTPPTLPKFLQKAS